MWSLKFRAKEENLFSSRTKRFAVKILFYSQSYYEERKKLYFIGQGMFVGDETKKKMFFENLKKDKKIVHLEVNKNFFISVYQEVAAAKRAAALKTVYNPKILFLKPTVIDEDGWEEWHLASFDRNELEKIIEFAKIYIKDDFKIQALKEKKVTNLIFKTLSPSLTIQQEKAINLAIKEGYYGYPRKITLKQLAKFMSISESTYQFHLAKAEQKMIPFLKD